MKKQFAFMLDERMRKLLESEAERKDRSMSYLINNYIKRCANRDIEKAKNLAAMGRPQSIEDMDEED